jgi:hypothetical protein
MTCTRKKSRGLLRALHTCNLVAYLSLNFVTQPNRCVLYHGILIALLRLAEDIVTHENLLPEITAGAHMALLQELSHLAGKRLRGKNQ